jgi:pimeloyl-ACP methyl ester carboxylesterase
MLATIAGPAGHIFIDDDGVIESQEPPVVFVHSFAGAVDHWREQLAHLRPGRRAIAIDLRGHGESDPPSPGLWNVEGFAADIAAVTEQLSLVPFVLVGHSMGGSASIAFAGAHPDQVAGLVVAGTPGRSDPEMARKVVASIEADYEPTMTGYWDKLLEGARPEVAHRVRARIGNLPRDVSIEIIRSVFAYDPLPALRAYHGPVLVIDTARDQGPAALHQQMPLLRHEVIPGTSHWMQMDKPAEFDAILDRFLAGIEAQPARRALPRTPGLR